jgi:hypothetical protein
LKRGQADPNGAAHARAVAVGRANAKAVVDSALDPNSKMHETHWNFFKGCYNCNAELLEKDMIAKEISDSGDGLSSTEMMLTKKR